MPRLLRDSLVWLACAVLCQGMVAIPLAEASQSDFSRRPFTDDEKASLRAGELVVRETREVRGTYHLVGGTSWQVIDRPLDAVWQGLMDTPRYHRWMPQVSRALLTDGNDTQRLLRIEHDTGPFDVHYYLRAKVVKTRGDVTFRLAKTSDGSLKAAWGFFKVQAYGPDRTLFSFGVMADIGDGLIAGVLRGTAQEWMLKIPWLMKKFMEGSGRWIYK